MTFDPSVYCQAATRSHPYPVFVNIADGTTAAARAACQNASINTSAANFTVREASIGGSAFPFQINALGTGSSFVDSVEAGGLVRLITTFSVTGASTSFVAFNEPCEVFKVRARLTLSGANPLVLYLNWRDAANHLRLVVGPSLITFQSVVEGAANTLQEVENTNLFPSGTTPAANFFLFCTPTDTDGFSHAGFGTHAFDARTFLHLFSTTLQLPAIGYGPAVGCPVPRSAEFQEFRGSRRAFVCDPYLSHYKNPDLAEYWGEAAYTPPGEGFVTQAGRPVAYGSGVGLPALLSNNVSLRW
jgi:hypothetical protein